MKATAKPSNVVRLHAPKKPRKPAKRKAADGWRAAARSHKVKDGRPVILRVPIEGMGDDFKEWIGEAYFDVETASWWRANTAPNRRGAVSVRDAFGAEPSAWHPMPSPPPMKPEKPAVKPKVKKAARKGAN